MQSLDAILSFINRAPQNCDVMSHLDDADEDILKPTSFKDASQGKLFMTPDWSDKIRNT